MIAETDTQLDDEKVTEARDAAWSVSGVEFLVASLDTSARLGQADAACREAGRACAVLRGANLAQWRKFNALPHRLSRHVHCD